MTGSKSNLAGQPGVVVDKGGRTLPALRQFMAHEQVRKEHSGLPGLKD